MPFSIEGSDELLSTTRAVRKRLDLTRPVPRQVILDCIGVAQQAPTGSNQQLWRWIVVTDPGKRHTQYAAKQRDITGVVAEHRPARRRPADGDVRVGDEGRRR